jgi:hypothetical protein
MIPKPSSWDKMQMRIGREKMPLAENLCQGVEQSWAMCDCAMFGYYNNDQHFFSKLEL